MTDNEGMYYESVNALAIDALATTNALAPVP